jgi:tRNA(fMet)-specific endonuclease VapC
MEDTRVLIDTSVLIDHFRKKDKKNTILYELSEKYDLYISVITEFEFLIGLKKINKIDSVSDIFSNLTILDFGSNCVKVAVDIYKELKNKNKLIALPDLFIASTALYYNLSIATFNKKHFERVNGLEIIDI